MREVIYAVFGVLGLSLTPGGMERLGRWMGTILWYALPGRRRLTSETIAERLGVEPGEARRLARASFAHTCRSFLEIFLRTRADFRFFTERVLVTHPERLAALNADQGPKVLVTGHLGSWELGCSVARVLMPKISCGVIMRSLKNHALNDLVLQLRRRPNVGVIENQGAALKVVRILRRKGMAIFLVDHNCMRDMAVFLPFLGKVAAVNRGPAFLATHCNATVWPVFCTRRLDGGYVLHMEPSLDCRTLEGTEDEKVEAVARFYTEAVERAIRVCPEQWFWMHKRWKTRPPEEDASGGGGE